MTGLDDDRTVDQAVEAAIRRIAVPDHAPDFWQRLDTRLESGTLHGTGPTGAVPMQSPEEAAPTDPPASGRGRSDRRRRTVAMAAVATAVAVAAVAVAVVLVRDPDGGGRVEIGPSDTRAGSATTSTTGPTRSAPAPTSSTSTPEVPPGSEDAVLRFVDAVGRGDVAGASMGPLSEAHINTDGGSVEDFVRQAAEGFGAWADAEDRATSTVVLGPGDVVVVVSGRVQQEGAVEERVEAFPVRYSESAGGWLVEPRAFDPGEPGQLQLDTPAADISGAPPTLDRIDRVVAATPGDGTAWLAIDDQPPTATTVGPDGEASWSLDDPLPPGRHVLTLAFVNDATFVALSEAFLVAS